MSRYYPSKDTARKTESADVFGAEVWTYETESGTPFAYGWRSSKQVKHDFHHRFRDVAERDRFIDDWFSRQVQIADAKAERAGKRREQNAQPNPVNVGDVFVNSWGYDQTNVDFYQVVGLTPRGVKLREIGSETVTDNGDMSGRVVARRDKFTSEAILTKRLYFFDNKPCVSMDHGHCGLWDGKPQYESSYH